MEFVSFRWLWHISPKLRPHWYCSWQFLTVTHENKIISNFFPKIEISKNPTTMESSYWIYDKGLRGHHLKHPCMSFWEEICRVVLISLSLSSSSRIFAPAHWKPWAHFICPEKSDVFLPGLKHFFILAVTFLHPDELALLWKVGQEFLIIGIFWKFLYN